MSIEIARYQFHSWARKGIAANINEGDDLGAGTATKVDRAEITVPVALNGNGISKTFALIGPGDIIGINQNMIVRVEPLNWITDFEPNYLAFIEFYDEDFVWRYSPAAPQGAKLRPWLFLIVLKEDEFDRTKRQMPVPSIVIKNNEAFPPHNETWLWAHVHSDADIPDSELSDYEQFLLSLNKTVNDDPDQIYCRLMSPRKLEANTAYHAFLIPAFETGRLAGLEQPTDAINAQLPSWDADGAHGEMPVYFEWFFRTGTNADFESLVKLLQPRPMDPKVGIRDMDCSRPGFVRADDSTLEIPGTAPPIIGLEGALKSPSTVSTKFPNPETEKDFQVELQKIVNLPATIISRDDSSDPVISVPLYGGKHAKKSANEVVLFDINKMSWLHDLNKDPRTRVPGGFGTLVIQKNQEAYMRKAWSQVMKIIEANKQIKATMFYMNVALNHTRKTFAKLPGNVLLAISKPVLPRIMGSPVTIYQQIRDSRLPAATFSGAFRRIVRPNGKLIKKLRAASGEFSYDTLVSQLNDGTVTAAPPKTTPGGMPDIQDFADQIFPYNFPPWVLWLIRHYQIIFIILVLLFLLIAWLTGSFLFLVIAIILAALYFFAMRLKNNLTTSELITDPQKELEAVAQIPQQPAFTLRLSDETTAPPRTPTTPGTDSVEGRNFRTALVDFTKRLAAKAPEKTFSTLNLVNTQNKVGAAIHPYTSFPFRLSALVQFPAYIRLADPEKIFPAMAYPDFEDPMYKKLCEISDELLLPNLKLIPPNTISLLKTNQKFIESYMVGLNYEMGRELLWREYPTDERGSYFRQFWDVKGIIRPADGKTEAELTEDYKDIKPIHTWSINSLLGKHNNRDAEGDAEQTVLVIRGDLLKRYPNTVIFAQKAIAGDNAEEQQIDLDLTAEEFKTQVKFPLYKAEVAPDIKFFGFDLTIKQAKGIDVTDPFTDHLGWFFIIQEVPGEARFGMDITFNAGSDGLSWDDLAWTNFDDDIKFIKAGVKPSIHPADDFRWAADSANMAFILFQKPSMVAVHAKEMLENITP